MVYFSTCERKEKSSGCKVQAPREEDETYNIYARLLLESSQYAAWDQGGMWMVVSQPG